ncbi:MAG: hypothetical protein ACFFBD_30555, partial [Candidatus Hodarchaeota archaeon]
AVKTKSGEIKHLCVACSRRLKSKRQTRETPTPTTRARRRTSSVLEEELPTPSPPPRTSPRTTPTPRSTTTPAPRPSVPPSRPRRRVSRKVTTLKHITPGLDVPSMASLRILILIIGIALLLIGITLGDHFLVSEWAQYEWARRLGY